MQYYVPFNFLLSLLKHRGFLFKIEMVVIFNGTFLRCRLNCKDVLN